MKTLRKSGEYIRVKNSSTKEQAHIDNLVENGWFFCSKKDWKDWKAPVEKVKTKKTKK